MGLFRKKSTDGSKTTPKGAHTDWTASPAHLLLLSKFLNSEAAERFDNDDRWAAVLHEHPADAIRGFREDGALEAADLDEVMDRVFKAGDLKTMLKERGLKISGPKNELIQRLIENDPAGMKTATKNSVVYRCSEKGGAACWSLIVSAADLLAEHGTLSREWLYARLFRIDR